MESKGITVEFDKEKFQEGVNEFSDVCGGIAAMISLGITPDKALDYFIKMLRVNGDVEIAHCNLDSVLEQLGAVDKNIENDEDENGLLTKSVYPHVCGVAIVCDGAGDSVIKQRIIETVCALFDINSTNISVVRKAG